MAAPTTQEPNGIARRNSNIAAVATVIATLIALGGIFWKFAGEASGMQTEINNIRLQNTSSVDDRRALTEKVTKLEGNLEELTREYHGYKAQTTEKLIDRERQIKALEQFASVRQSHTDRWIGLLWGKTYGETWPGAVQFYPKIAVDE